MFLAAGSQLELGPAASSSHGARAGDPEGREETPGGTETAANRQSPG